jgi:murein DD-endopeptidase MepM/ murein hydrolase activator NlpD
MRLLVSLLILTVAAGGSARPPSSVPVPLSGRVPASGPMPVAGLAGRSAGRTVATVGGGSARRVSSAAGLYRPPVPGTVRVLRSFSPPLTPYGPGHLGADLALDGGTVLAAGAGVVRFAGPVAGRSLVVIAHPDGITTEYEPLTPTVTAGTAVVAGQPIGRLAGVHPGCPAPECLHWGARRNGQYLDPMSLLRPLGVVRLLPWDWVPPADRAAPPSRADAVGRFG